MAKLTKAQTELAERYAGPLKALANCPNGSGAINGIMSYVQLDLLRQRKLAAVVDYNDDVGGPWYQITDAGRAAIAAQGGDLPMDQALIDELNQS